MNARNRVFMILGLLTVGSLIWYLLTARSSGDLLGNYYGRGYSSDASYLYAAPRTPFAPFDRLSLDRNEFTGDSASLRYPTLVRSIDGDFRR